MKAKRNIVKIDREKCNGCGLCVSACAEGAIKMIDGKAELVSDNYCDGLGACLGECPQGAITIEEREADAFDEKAVHEHLKKEKIAMVKHETGKVPCSCPGMKVMDFSEPKIENRKDRTAEIHEEASELRQWPVQLHLVPPNAPYWDGANLLIAADCCAFAYASFHQKLLRGRRLVIACPKLDDTEGYVEKLAEIFSNNDIKSVLVAHMEVPCCGGLLKIVQQALELSGKSIPFAAVKVGLQGNLLNKI